MMFRFLIFVIIFSLVIYVIYYFLRKLLSGKVRLGGANLDHFENVENIKTDSKIKQMTAKEKKLKNKLGLNEIKETKTIGNKKS